MLTIRDLSFSYMSEVIFSKINITFDAGWTALIGANGSGKSTLLKLITGILIPQSGVIQKQDLKIAFCQQTSETLPAVFTDSDYLNDKDFFPLISRLEIKDDWLNEERYAQLSGGEKKRMTLADMLIRKPDCLLLDEPANHIDTYTLNLLQSALKTFTGIGICVSHNMAFINDLCTKTVMLRPAKRNAPENGRGVFSFNTKPQIAREEFLNMQNYLREKSGGLIHTIDVLSKQKHEMAAQAKHDKLKRMSKKDIDKHDSDTRAKINLARLTGRDRTGGRKVAVLEYTISFKQKEAALYDAEGIRKSGAKLHGKKSEKPILYSLDAGKTELVKNELYLIHPMLEIRNDSRIVLAGNNGAGKTSLIKKILNDLKNKDITNANSFVYMKQELSTGEMNALHMKFMSIDDKQKGDVLSCVYRLGSEVNSILNTQSLSPGEARKLLFAFAMLNETQFLILDEPTNHMDIEAAETFATAIKEFSGAVLLVTHDRLFAEKTGEKDRISFWNINRKGNESKLIVNTVKYIK